MSSRYDALQRLEEFLSKVPSYGRDRNYDRPGHEGVSRLSQWIRYRVISEEECVRAVLAQHPFEVAEKFIQEIMWRTYWKGWLEMRSCVWSFYSENVKELSAEWSEHERYRAACEGRTDLSFFNDWRSELVTTGYLHNHTRMWFASVWIFTLQLPWQLGAALFFRHLLDADPASNTLSWRWVAGLHTPGKIYLARPDNIATFSQGRWSPRSGELVNEAKPIKEECSFEITPLKAISSEPPKSGSLIIIHDDDLSADLSDELGAEGLHYALLYLEKPHQSLKVNEHLSAVRGDATLRAKASPVATADEIISFARTVGVATIHIFMPFVGHDQAVVMQIAEDVRDRGISVVWHRRAWDSNYLPLARAGFFSFWQKCNY